MALLLRPGSTVSPSSTAVPSASRRTTAQAYILRSLKWCPTLCDCAYPASMPRGAATGRQCSAAHLLCPAFLSWSLRMRWLSCTSPLRCVPRGTGVPRSSPRHPPRLLGLPVGRCTLYHSNSRQPCHLPPRHGLGVRCVWPPSSSSSTTTWYFAAQTPCCAYTEPSMGIISFVYL